MISKFHSDNRCWSHGKIFLLWFNLTVCVRQLLPPIKCYIISHPKLSGLKQQWLSLTYLQISWGSVWSRLVSTRRGSRFGVGSGSTPYVSYLLCTGGLARISHLSHGNGRGIREGKWKHTMSLKAWPRLRTGNCQLCACTCLGWAQGLGGYTLLPEGRTTKPYGKRLDTERC